MGSALGIPNDKLLALDDYLTDRRFTDEERLALEYADSITFTDQDVSDELFSRLRERWDDDALVELTEVIAWENASSKFNHALHIPSQNLWKR